MITLRREVRTLALCAIFWVGNVDAFSIFSSCNSQRIIQYDAAMTTVSRRIHTTTRMVEGENKSEKEDPIQAVINAMYGGQPLISESPGETRARIEDLVKENHVLLFMKGSKSFPQCGFSDTATKILETLETDFQSVDVLSDEAIRQGIKQYSQWPTIPQLYVGGEFIGGSDIMMEMYENGELKALLKKKSDD